MFKICTLFLNTYKNSVKHIDSCFRNLVLYLYIDFKDLQSEGCVLIQYALQ